MSVLVPCYEETISIVEENKEAYGERLTSKIVLQIAQELEELFTEHKFISETEYTHLRYRLFSIIAGS